MISRIDIKPWMVPADVVEYYLGECEVDKVLWEQTDWPYWDMEVIEEQVYGYYLKTKIDGA
jgi:hypothetical protein